jgi:nucleoside-diphosphate-sugar epimerase
MPLKTVFLTGASGFVGAHLSDELLRRGCQVRCLVRPSAKAEHLDRPGIVRGTGTLEDPASYRDGLDGCDTVFHVGGLVAARSPAELLRINGRATGHLADACAALPRPPRLVYVSSLAAAGPPPVERAYRDEADRPTPVSDYGRRDAAHRGYYFACDDREHPTYWQFGRRVADALGRRVIVWPLWRWVGSTVGGVSEAVSQLTGSTAMLSRDKVREATAWSWACSGAKARAQLAFVPARPLDFRLRETAEWYRDHGWL